MLINLNAKRRKLIGLNTVNNDYIYTLHVDRYTHTHTQ